MNKWELLLVNKIFRLKTLLTKYESHKLVSLIVSALLVPILVISLTIALGTAIGAGVNTNNYNEYQTSHKIYSLTEQYSTKHTINWETAIKVQNKTVKTASSYILNKKIEDNKKQLTTFESKSPTDQGTAAKDASWSDVNAYHNYLREESNLNYVYAGTSEYIGSVVSTVIFSLITLVIAGIIYKIKKTKKPKLTNVVGYEETTNGMFAEPS